MLFLGHAILVATRLDDPGDAAVSDEQSKSTQVPFLSSSLEQTVVDEENCLRWLGHEGLLSDLST